jgi:cell division protein ZapA (FtsZ GTPase activity inhibitor)
MAVTQEGIGVNVTHPGTETETVTVIATIMTTIEIQSLKTRPPFCRRYPEAFLYLLGLLHWIASVRHSARWIQLS